MGIDKPGENGTREVNSDILTFSDVRYVLHFDMPKSFEGLSSARTLRSPLMCWTGYYQETGEHCACIIMTVLMPAQGRAGRDGKVRMGLERAAVWTDSSLIRHQNAFCITVRVSSLDSSRRANKAVPLAREDAVRIISLVKKSQQSRVPKVSLNAGPGPKHSSASSLKAVRHPPRYQLHCVY